MSAKTKHERHVTVYRQDGDGLPLLGNPWPLVIHRNGLKPGMTIVKAGWELEQDEVIFCYGGDGLGWGLHSIDCSEETGWVLHHHGGRHLLPSGRFESAPSWACVGTFASYEDEPTEQYCGGDLCDETEARESRYW
jgi:hypothetical protein